jgi:hypothetical protein
MASECGAGRLQYGIFAHRDSNPPGLPYRQFLIEHSPACSPFRFSSLGGGNRKAKHLLFTASSRLVKSGK